jgi:carbon monoxide dehydrogenase subunit G
MNLQAETLVALPPSHVWSRLVDLDRAAATIPFIEQLRLIDPPPLQVGSRAEITLVFKGQSVKAQAHITALEPERRVAVLAHAPQASADVKSTWLLEPSGGGTRLRQTVELSFTSVMMRMAARAMLGAALSDQALKASLDAFKTSLESEAAG